MAERMISDVLSKPDVALELTLRPSLLSEFTGQAKIKQRTADGPFTNEVSHPRAARLLPGRATPTDRAALGAVAQCRDRRQRRARNCPAQPRHTAYRQ